MRRVLPAAAITAIGLIALASFRTTQPSVSIATNPVRSHRVAVSSPRPPTTTTPAAAPPPDTTGTAPPSTTPVTPAAPAAPTGTFAGDPYDNQYGTVQVRATLQDGRLTAITALQMPFEHSRSQFISQQAEPLLRQEALQAQSAQIDIISGATYTSESYAQSLQSALDRARPQTTVRRAEAMWGTVISIDVRDNVEATDLDACFAWFQRVDDLFSTWRPDTEIMKIGREELAAKDAGPEVIEVLDLCDRMRTESSGAFDIAFGARDPHTPRLDPSGVVKGWAIERAADLLTQTGARCFSINAGGDVVTRGRPEGSAGWRVGIQHPWERGRVAAVLQLEDAAVATSGLYERGEHVLDPRTGTPARELASVTVVGPDAGLADAYATATVVLGASDGMRWLSTRTGYCGMAITQDQRVILTPGFDRIRVPTELSAE